jgi:predicted nucleic acid-binding protein
MKIIVDTSVWSQFLMRRDPQESRSLSILRSGIREKNIQMLGIIRQELLSGIKDRKQYTKVFELLASFPDLLAESSDHTEAAKFFNICRKNGIQGSPIDFLICAQASRNNLSILTEDKDFQLYAKYIPVELV